MRVLYIEDSAMDADLARLTLARTAPEIKLEVASTLREGLERLNDKSNVYDLLLTDLSLPDGSGLEALTRVREQRLGHTDSGRSPTAWGACSRASKWRARTG